MSTPRLKSFARTGVSLAGWCLADVGRIHVKSHATILEVCAPLHVCLYKQGALGLGVRIGARKKGQSVMDVREDFDVEEKEKHLLEVVTDADQCWQSK